MGGEGGIRCCCAVAGQGLWCAGTVLGRVHINVPALWLGKIYGGVEWCRDMVLILGGWGGYIGVAEQWLHMCAVDCRH